MTGTQKVASTGRFGSRYGVGIRRKLLKIEPLQFQKHKCPNCGSPRVKRQSKGIFECSKCSHSFVGGSYIPQTLAGTIISKMVNQKVFAPEMVGQLSKGQGEVHAAAPAQTVHVSGARPVEHKGKDGSESWAASGEEESSRKRRQAQEPSDENEEGK